MTSTIAHPKTRSHRTPSAVTAALIVALVTIATFAVAQTMTDEDPRPAPAVGPRVTSQLSDGRAIAEWARSNGLSGLSPASVGPAAFAEQRARVMRDLNEWVRSNGLSGLSPASVGPVGLVAAGDSVIGYAEANGLSGLSPASLRPRR